MAHSPFHQKAGLSPCFLSCGRSPLALTSEASNIPTKMNSTWMSDIHDHCLISCSSALTNPARASQSDGGGYSPPLPTSRGERKERTNAMVREILQFVDGYSIMRKPSWDGVRILLLLLPLMEGDCTHQCASVLTANVLQLDGQLPLEILTMYEATLAQISALASLTALAPSVSLHDNSPGMHAYTSDALVKARIFWYAYINEGIMTALRGGRLMLYVPLLDRFCVFSMFIPSVMKSTWRHSKGRYPRRGRRLPIPLRFSGLTRSLHKSSWSLFASALSAGKSMNCLQAGMLAKERSVAALSTRMPCSRSGMASTHVGTTSVPSAVPLSASRQRKSNGILRVGRSLSSSAVSLSSHSPRTLTDCHYACRQHRSRCPQAAHYLAIAAR